MNCKTLSPFWGENLAKMLRAPKVNPFPEVTGTFMARDALSLAGSYLNLHANDVVLLPAYLCREVLKPFPGKSRVEFYDVGHDLAADPEDMQGKLAENSVRMLLIINYFGFLQPYRKEIKHLSSERGITLIEDCAHSLLTEGSGETGDLSVYSFRKILPLPDGGGLKIHVQGRRRSLQFYPKMYSNILSILAITKSLLNVRSETLSRAGISSRMKSLFHNGASTKRDSRILALSSLA